MSLRIPFPYNLDILTSNPYKTKEYKALTLNVVEGDIDEVDGTLEEVAIYKALSAPLNTMVEDTVVVIGNKPIVDWKFSYNNHAEDEKEFKWCATMSYRDENFVYVYQSSLLCFFQLPNGKRPTSPHFDDYALAYGAGDGLLEDQKLLPQWSRFDPRNRVLREMEDGYFVLKIPVSVIAPWTGEYQK